ncbi:hypothetical protein LWM68_40670 [Niabella sp. W65]|nr:hypothetical protein [Niabella sp. W65]MCH7368491.1 hypothetical protein [Niabella sp. W65]ULT44080.1 hypothetical protein KRR40_12360 [Niabella sp. I65]
MQQFNKRFIKIDEYEQKIAEIAIEKGFDNVICGHIHQPKKERLPMRGVRFATSIQEIGWRI